MKYSEMISIIVPVYNVENYLDNCINSLINQTYDNIEIILVDDGSTDGSGSICDKYAEYDNITIIHKKNGGLSDARNVGLKKSRGKYVTFVDSDDDVETDMIEYLYNLVNNSNAEMSICPQNIVINEDKKIDLGINYRDKILNTKDALKILLCDDEFTASACSKLYKKELFNDVEFPYGKLFEDSATTYKLIMKSSKIAYGHLSKYNYYKRENSIMTGNFNLKKMDLIEQIDIMTDNILNDYPDLFQYALRKKILARFSVLRQIVFSDYYNSKITDELVTYLVNYKKFIINSGLFKNREKIALLTLLISKKLFKFSWKIYCKIKY